MAKPGQTEFGGGGGEVACHGSHLNPFLEQEPPAH